MLPAIRSLARTPGFTAAAVLTLALGIGANTAMFSVVDGVLLKPLRYREPDRLISLHVRITPLKNLGVLPLPPFIYQLWRDHATTLASLALVRPSTENLTGEGQPERLLTANVSSSFFSTLGVAPARGRAFLANEEAYPGPRLAILSDGFWRRRFAADPKIVGRSIQLNGAGYTVIGVMARGFELPIDLETPHAVGFDVLLPLNISPEQRLNHGYWGVARLKPGVTIEQARSDLDARLASLNESLTRNAIIAPLHTNLTERVRRGFSLLMAAVGMVLLIACGNLANLLLSRGLTARKELAVRAALGASRWQIACQMLSESLVLSGLGGAIGVLCSGWILSAVLTQLPQILPHRGAIAIDTRALAFSLAATIWSTLVFAALPAWRFSNADPQEALRQSQRGALESRGSDRLRRWFLAAQVGLSTVLLIGSGLLLRSFEKILSLDRGFETENVLTAEIPLEGERYRDVERRNSTYRAIEERLAGIPGVSIAGAVNWLPLAGDDYQNPIFLPGRPLTGDRLRELPIAQVRYASPGYFRAAGIALRFGRFYSAGAADTWTALVSASAAGRLWPGRDPIGQEFTIDESPNPRIWRVGGVVNDVPQTEMTRPAPLMVYLPLAHNRGMNLSFVLRTNLPVDSVAGAVRQAVWAVDADVPVTAIRRMSEIVARSTAQRRFQTLVLSGFAAAAMLLAALGIYGTVSYAVNRRYREIGIRLALGAQNHDIGTLVLRQGLAPVALGIGAGFAGAFPLMRVISALLYGVGAGDLPTYAATGALVLLVAALSCWWPARRAMRLDPLESMRDE